MIRCRGIFHFTVQQEIKRLKCFILSGHLIIRVSIGRGDSMGYTTEFIGKFTFNREPSKELKDYINCFAKTIARSLYSDARSGSSSPHTAAYTRQ